jgi:hypothetical protein
MDGPTRCSSLSLKREEHQKINSGMSIFAEIDTRYGPDMRGVGACPANIYLTQLLENGLKGDSSLGFQLKYYFSPLRGEVLMTFR